jgi:predicted molibdopterin-dependent oxidoreductase YjgC
MANPALILNGKSVEFEPGQTILEAAHAQGVRIPTLCYLKGCSPTGACGICVVEVAGSDHLMLACSSPAEAGMAIKTDSERVCASRRETLAKLVASGDHNCFVMDLPPDQWSERQLGVMLKPWHDQVCPAHGDCRLQDLVVEYGVSLQDRVAAPVERPLDDSHPVIIRDFSRCIQCGRCKTAGCPWPTMITAPTAGNACRPARWGPCSSARPMAKSTGTKPRRSAPPVPTAGWGVSSGCT